MAGSSTKKYITAEMAYVLAMLVFGLSVALMPVFTTFFPMAGLAVLTGLAAGTTASLVMVIVRCLVPITDGAGALGLLLLFWGVGDIVGTLAAGNKAFPCSLFSRVHLFIAV